MTAIAIVGNGPIELLPDLTLYREIIDLWIGADRGAYTLVENQIIPDYAVGDFDSISVHEKEQIQKYARNFSEYPAEKDQTDLEIAILKAYELNPDTIYLLGVTGGRIDHELINIQTLYSINKNNIKGIIADKNNQLEMVNPGKYQITFNENYPNISFVPFTENIEGLTLEGFYYPLADQTISWGSTLCISNKLLLKNGTFSFSKGILLLIKSRDATDETIPK
ncbi:thiamine diphosphokinase [Virgibacillus oceani]|uniref:Thiamine diphosphokinase n=1 Tax=Virgibacillus oceani TaxID=1479511 RepID=A0A917H7C0_9BACI|nr:thiamine diphosphokinase [Virgibacillus oceani]GGG69368.1 thiamine pyrophosphokinase [Virgibacillus oceani]